MKNKNFLFLSAFVALILAVGLACSALSGTPSQPDNPPAQTEAPVAEGSTTTFTDQGKLYQIDVPADWKYSQTVDKTNNYYYIDSFKSPDENALIENIVYDDGKAFSGSDKGRFALYLLNTFYSNTGKEGDIKVSDDSIMQDGSERLTWSSRAGGYSGISFLETRGNTTFLLFTAEWVDQYEDQYLDILNSVIESYTVP